MSEVIAVEQMKQCISKIERLEQEKSDLMADIKLVYDEAKSHGFDVKIIKQIIKLKRADKNKLAEEEAILDLYREALGL